MLTVILGRLANSRIPLIKNLFITIFCHCYTINMAEAVEEKALAYPSFHDFFIRRLKVSARPIFHDVDAILSPADGTLSQYGALEKHQLLQAKGKSYSVVELLANDNSLAETFCDGSHALIYLAPHNYHRVHMPMTGKLSQMIYVPGKLYSVSPATAENIDGLFAKNERVIAIFETSIGKMAVVLIGAMIVGSITTVWAGKITPPRHRRKVTYVDYTSGNIVLSAGEELGYFSLGSTVIMLFEKNRLNWSKGLEATAIQMGQHIASQHH